MMIFPPLGFKDSVVPLTAYASQIADFVKPFKPCNRAPFL